MPNLAEKTINCLAKTIVSLACAVLADCVTVSV